MGKDSLDNKIYDDVASPANKGIGNFLNDMVGSLRWKYTQQAQIDAMNQRLADRIKTAIDEIPSDRLTQPNPSIATPLLETLLIRNEDDEVFKSAKQLLIAASDDKYAGMVHPAFAAKINEMASEEINLLKLLNNPELLEARYNARAFKKRTPRRMSSGWFFQDTVTNKILNHLEMRDTQHDCKKEPYTSIESVSEILFPLSSLSSPELIDIYITHLESMGYVQRNIFSSNDIDNLLFTPPTFRDGRRMQYFCKDEHMGNALLSNVSLSSLGELFVNCSSEK